MQIIYASLTAIAAVQSRESAHDHENAMGNITKPPSSTVSPIDLYNAAVMTKLECKEETYVLKYYKLS